MKSNVFAILGCLTLAITLQHEARSVDCSGFCIQCRTDALSVCGAGCVQNYSCSLSTCTCSFGCRSGCHPANSANSRSTDLLRDRLTSQPASWTSSDNRYSPPNIRFDVIAQPEVPLAIANLGIENDLGRQSSELNYTVRNESGSNLRTIHIMLVFFNDLGEPLGGESLTETLRLAPQAAQHFRVPLSHYVDSGNRVAIAFSAFKTATQSWLGDHEAIISAMKQR